MAITKEKKKGILEKLQKIFHESKNITFLNFHGLSVGRAVEIRRRLKESKVGYFVAKKTLIRKALEGEKVEGQMPSLEGELALAYGDDLVAPAREAFGFQKKFEKALSIIGGIFEGKFFSQNEMTAVAAIPPLETLRAQFVNLINSPIQRLVIALNEVAKKRQ